MDAVDRQMSRTYRSAGREERARLTRRRVVDAASTLFLARGYAGTTIRSIAARADVSVPTVELLFGTKAALLKSAIDVAIAGDDEPVPVLERDWTVAAMAAQSANEFLAIGAGVIAAAQARSAGLVLAVFEGSISEPGLAELALQMTRQRTGTATWLVTTLSTKATLRAGNDIQDAVDTLWILMDPAIYDRLVRQRGWRTEQYRSWFARSARRLLIADAPPISLEETT
jgi:AcrR family transcriptional regulator